MPACKNCNHEVTLEYCPACGYPAHLKRIDSHFIRHEILHVLHLEKGIFYSIKELIIRPGKSVRTFIREDRSRLVKPVIFLIVASLAYSIINHFFHIEQGYVSAQGIQGTATNAIFAWVQSHYGYANIIMSVFIALWLKVFFRKYDYNIFEIVILLCFVMGVGMLLYAVFALVEGITNVSVMQIAGVLGFVYSTWAIGQFYDGRKISSYLKAFAAYVVGLLTITILALLAGALIDSMMKH